MYLAACGAVEGKAMIPSCRSVVKDLSTSGTIVFLAASDCLLSKAEAFPTLCTLVRLTTIFCRGVIRVSFAAGFACPTWESGLMKDSNNVHRYYYVPVVVGWKAGRAVHSLQSPLL